MLSVVEPTNSDFHIPVAPSSSGVSVDFLRREERFCAAQSSSLSASSLSSSSLRSVAPSPFVGTHQQRALCSSSERNSSFVAEYTHSACTFAPNAFAAFQPSRPQGLCVAPLVSSRFLPSSLSPSTTAATCFVSSSLSPSSSSAHHPPRVVTMMSDRLSHTQRSSLLTNIIPSACLPSDCSSSSSSSSFSSSSFAAAPAACRERMIVSRRVLAAPSTVCVPQTTRNSIEPRSGAVAATAISSSSSFYGGSRPLKKKYSLSSYSVSSSAVSSSTYGSTRGISFPSTSAGSATPSTSSSPPPASTPPTSPSSTAAASERSSHSPSDYFSSCCVLRTTTNMLPAPPPPPQPPRRPGAQQQKQPSAPLWPSRAPAASSAFPFAGMCHHQQSQAAGVPLPPPGQASTRESTDNADTAAPEVSGFSFSSRTSTPSSNTDPTACSSQADVLLYEMLRTTATRTQRRRVGEAEQNSQVCSRDDGRRRDGDANGGSREGHTFCSPEEADDDCRFSLSSFRGGGDVVRHQPPTTSALRAAAYYAAPSSAGRQQQMYALNSHRFTANNVSGISSSSSSSTSQQLPCCYLPPLNSHVVRSSDLKHRLPLDNGSQPPQLLPSSSAMLASSASSSSSSLLPLQHQTHNQRRHQRDASQHFYVLPKCTDNNNATAASPPSSAAGFYRISSHTLYSSTTPLSAADRTHAEVHKYLAYKLQHTHSAKKDYLHWMCFNFAETCRDCFSHLDLGGGVVDSTHRSSSLLELSRTAAALTLFLARYRIHEEDILAVFGTTLAYLQSMTSATLQPLLRQMVVWFDSCNILYFLAFLAHVFVLDDTVPLKSWGHRLSEGVAKGGNVNKCVRNLLKMRKYRLDVDLQIYEAMRSALQSH